MKTLSSLLIASLACACAPAKPASTAETLSEGDWVPITPEPC